MITEYKVNLQKKTKNELVAFISQLQSLLIKKDKIEELTNTKGDFATYIATSERIKVLQELLQESEDK